MEKVIYDLRLNIKHAGCKQQIELKKGESNARVFRIELSDGTEPIKLNAIDHTAVIRGLKADHTIIYDTASINEGKAEYTLGVQDTAAVGTTWYEVQIIDSGHSDNEKKVLYTAQFKAVVSDEVVDEGTITSSDSFNRLETIINNNQSWLEQAREDIDYRTLVYDSELKLNSSDNTTPDKKHDDFYDADLLRFTTNWFTNDCDFLEIKNNSSNNVCNVYGRNATGNEVYIESVIGTQRINLTEYAEYKLVIAGKGPYDADITKFKFYKYKYISAAIDDVNKKHKEDIDQVYAKHNTDFETIRQRKIAELSLEKDITASELQAKLKESDNYSSDVTQAWLERFDDDIKLSQKFKNAIKEETSGKVDKENGKSLIDDNEIERLKKVNNYDDTNIKKQFNDEIEKLKGTLIENTVSGTECVVDDSADMPIQELHLYGKSEQPVTTGAQLFDVNNKLNWNSVFSVDDED